MQSNSSSRTGRIGIAGTQLIFERLGCIFREQPIEDYGIDAHTVNNNTIQKTKKGWKLLIPLYLFILHLTLDRTSS